MRLLGTLSDSRQARTLGDYLLTQNIPTRLMEENGAWDVWVQNEDQVEAAKALWSVFQRNPADPRFDEAAPTASAIKKKERQANLQWQRNFRTAGQLWGRPALQQVPLTATLIGICIVVFLLTGFGDPANPSLRFFTFTDRHLVDPILPARGRMDVRWLEAVHEIDDVYAYGGIDGIKHGELWRLVTPIFIHFGVLHLLFNMYLFFGLGGLVEFRRGWPWMLIFVLSAGVISNTAQYFFPSAFDLQAWLKRAPDGPSGLFGGMSGVLYALFGYLWMKTRFDPEPGLLLPKDLIWIRLVWLVICIVGIIPHVANTAHVVGLICGIVAGATPKLWRMMRT
jgi:GlpG protein